MSEPAARGPPGATGEPAAWIRLDIARPGTLLKVWRRPCRLTVGQHPSRMREVLHPPPVCDAPRHFYRPCGLPGQQLKEAPHARGYVSPRIHPGYLMCGLDLDRLPRLSCGPGRYPVASKARVRERKKTDAGSLTRPRRFTLVGAIATADDLTSTIRNLMPRQNMSSPFLHIFFNEKNFNQVD